MPFSVDVQPQILDQWLGDTAPTIPGTVYVGLVLQLGQLSTALTAGTAYTSLACATDTAAYAGAAGDIILIGTSTSTDTAVASALWAAAATSISVDSFTPCFAHAIGTPFIRCSVYATAQEPSAGSYARVTVTNNTTNWPASTALSPGPGYTKLNGTTITFPAATASWGAVSGFLIADNATPGSGNVLVYGALSASQTIGSGNTPSFAADALAVNQN